MWRPRFETIPLWWCLFDTIRISIIRRQNHLYLIITMPGYIQFFEARQRSFYGAFRNRLTSHKQKKRENHRPIIFLYEDQISPTVYMSINSDVY